MQDASFSFHPLLESAHATRAAGPLERFVRHTICGISIWLRNSPLPPFLADCTSASIAIYVAPLALANFDARAHNPWPSSLRPNKVETAR